MNTHMHMWLFAATFSVLHSTTKKEGKKERLRIWFSSRIRTAVQILTGVDVK